MGLFDSKEQKDAKQEAKLKEAMAKYGLQDISDDYAPYVREIQLDLMGSSISHQPCASEPLAFAPRQFQETSSVPSAAIIAS